MKKSLFLAAICFTSSFAIQAQLAKPSVGAMNPANTGSGQQQNISARIANPISPLTNPMVQYGWEVMPAFTGGRWGTGPVFASPCISSTDTGFVYLMAGYDASFANTNLNTRYNTITKTYKNMAPTPSMHAQVIPLHVKGKIYLIGGYGATSFSPVATNDIYDVTTDTWSIGASMLTATGDYAAGVYKDSLIYYVGGYNGSADLNTVQIYNIYADTWTTGTAKIGTAVAGCRMGITGNSIVFAGGYSQTLATEISDTYLGTINTASPATVAWTALPSYPGGTVGRFGGGVSFEQNGLVYFCGGDPNGQGTSVLNTVYGYNISSTQWESGPNMPNGVSNISEFAGVVYNDSLFMVTMGGYDGTNVISVNNWLNVGPASLPPSVQTNTMVCNGASIQLNAYNGSSYAWTPKATLSDSTIANPVSNATATTTYTVTMGKEYGCPVTKMLTLTVNSLPTVAANSSSASICAGSTVTLNGSGTATTYTWTGIGVTDNVAFTPTNTDTYTVTGTDANNCVNTATVSVTVNSLPIVTLTLAQNSICDNTSSVALSGGTPAGGAYSGTGVSGGNFDPSVAGVGLQTVTYLYTDGNNCSASATDNMTVNNCSAGISAINEKSSSIYPNPNSGEFTIQLNESSAQVEITNGLGQIIMSFKMTGTSQQIDISRFEAGIYFVRIVKNNQVTFHTLVKK
jgi:hypothetical protein